MGCLQPPVLAIKKHARIVFFLTATRSRPNDLLFLKHRRSIVACVPFLSQSCFFLCVFVSLGTAHSQISKRGMASPAVSSRSSASRMRTLIASSPGVSVIGAAPPSSGMDLEFAGGVGGWTSSAQRTSLDSDRRSGLRLGHEAAATATTLWEDEKKELLHQLAALEATKDREIDHLKVRVGQLTKRVADLESSLSTVHRALEEEAATAIGLQRNVEATRLRHALARWRERMSIRRLRKEQGSVAQLMGAVDEALGMLPTAAGGSSAPHMRKALEELAWCERQWADQRLDHLKHSLHAFSGLAQQQPPSSPGSSPKGDASYLQSHGAASSVLSNAKVLLERADGIASAKFQVLLQSFQSYARCDKAHHLLEDVMRRVAPTWSKKDSPVPASIGPSEATRTLNDQRDDGGNHVLLRAMQYDVLKDTISSIVTVVIVPPALQLLQDAVAHHPALARLMDGLDEMIMQHPLTLQLERTLQDCFSKHLRFESVTEATPEHQLSLGYKLPEGTHVATAILYVEEPPSTGRKKGQPATSAATRQMLHGVPHNTEEGRLQPKTTSVPLKRALRWDLVHSILENSEESMSHAASRRSSTPRVAHVLSHVVSGRDEKHRSPLQDTSVSRLELARRSLRQSHRSTLL